MKTIQNIQHGFSLISAIFLLVVIAALGTFAVTLSTIQQQSAALDVMGARAYQAARAGIEWGAYQALRSSSCSASTTLAALPGTLANFTVTVQCSSTAASEAGTAITIYQLISTAKQGAVTTPDYVERQMSVTIAQ
jgi:MSHA biogenesis protein MshP